MVCLDPGYGALSTIGNLQFLEQMVTKFSDKGAGATLNSKFSTYNTSSAPVKNAVITKSKEIVNPTFVADYTSIDGVGHWRSPMLTAAASHGETELSANSLNATTITALLGNIHTKTTTKDNQMMNLLDLMFKSNTKN